MTRNHRVIVAAVAVTVACAAGVFVLVKDLKNYYAALPQFNTRALSSLDGCLKRTDFSACAQPIIDAVITRETGAQFMPLLEQHFNALQCHYVAHVMGEELYKHYSSIEDAMNSCSLECDSGCAHGIVGQAFAEQLGYSDAEEASTGQAFDLDHLSPAEISTIGAKLCSSGDSCHGVGHTLFAYYQKFEPAFSMCSAIAQGSHRDACATGVAMEYADDLQSKNFLTLPAMTIPTVESLSSLCNLPQWWQSRACFQYFPRMVQATLDRAYSSNEVYAKVEAVCRSEAPALRAACFAGIGTYRMFSIRTDPTGSGSFCEQFSDAQDQAACIHGMISSRTQNRQQEIVAFCATVKVEPIRAQCYQSFFHALSLKDGISMQDTETLCHNDPLCKQGYERYRLNPWQQIQKLARS